jgi:lipid II isoglutaminyl synthase (glutamine-hydrolysing)
MRTYIATAAGRAARMAITLSRRGGGTAAPGTLALRIDARYLRRRWGQLGSPRVIAITGTNGKTTTTDLVVRALEEAGYSVLTNNSGSNLLRGIASLFVQKINRKKIDVVVLEIDEQALLQVLPRLPIHDLVVLNLFRDQLDRFGEVNTVVQRWEDGLVSLPEAARPRCVINGQDPLLVMFGERLSMQGFSCVYFAIPAAGKGKNTSDADHVHCPRCGKTLVYTARAYSHVGSFACKNCMLQEHSEYTSSIEVKALRGAYNMANIAAAARLVALPPYDIRDDIRDLAWTKLKPQFGRQEVLQWRGVNVELVLVKNPTGANQALSLVDTASTVVLALNDAFADGTDVSWIWDVAYEQLAGRQVIVTGTRCYDLAIRLTVAGAIVQVESDIARALEVAVASGQSVQVLPTYTAMLAMRQVNGISTAIMTYPNLKLVWLYPELMNTYGDRGNVLILQYAARNLGINLDVIEFNAGDDPDVLAEADIYLMGGAQDAQQGFVMQDLTIDKAEVIAGRVAAGVPALLVCGAYQLFGSSYLAADGSTVPGLGVLPVHTKSAPLLTDRLVGDVVVDAGDLGLLIGFENHGGRTVLEEGAMPLGKVMRGGGNDGVSGYEGIVWNHVIGTYLHGCVLAKNPTLTQWLLEKAIENRSGSKVSMGNVHYGPTDAARRVVLDRWDM